MQFIAGGGGNEIGASFYLTLWDDGTVIATDCGGRPSSGFNPDIFVVGTVPTSKEFQPQEPDFSVVSNVDILLLTHGHLDHVLMVPVLARMHPRMQIYATAPTKAFCAFHWFETIKLAQHKNILSSFTQEEAEQALERIQIIEPTLDTSIRIRLTDRLAFCAVSAGHILGAVSYILYENNQPVGFYSGDIANHSQRTVLGAPKLTFDGLRFMVVESTRLTEQNEPRETIDERFITAIREAASRGMSIRILGFAIGRSNETYELVREAVGTTVPIYLEGAAKRISEIYLKYSPDGCIDPDIRTHFVADQSQRRAILAAYEPNIVIIPSAMQFGGLGMTYAEHGVSRTDHLFISPGWLDPCSPEYAFFETKGRVLSVRKRTIPILCKKERFSLTAHCDGNDIMEMHARMKPEKTILIHGDNTRMDQFLLQNPGKGFVKGENKTLISM